MVLNMYQEYSLNANPLSTPLEVHPLIADVFNNELPVGLYSIVADTGLILVVLETKTQLGTITTKIMPMKLGKLLNKLGFSQEECKDKSAELSSKLEIYKGNKLLITTTQEEVIDVYASSVTSCMAGSKAVAVYSTEDVAVAYVRVLGEIKARAVINKRDKLYYTMYGNSCLLGKLLKEAGFECDSGALDGCKLRIIKDSEGNILLPYLDSVSEVDLYHDHLLVQSGGAYTAQNTSEYLEDLRECEECDCTVNDDDSFYCEHTDRRLCSSCYDESYVLVDGRYYHKESDEIVLSNGGNYLLSDNAVFVENCGEYFHIDDVVYNEQTYEYYVADDTRHALCEEGEYEYYHIDDVEFYDGEWYEVDYLAQVKELEQQDEVLEDDF